LASCLYECTYFGKQVWDPNLYSSFLLFLGIFTQKSVVGTDPEPVLAWKSHGYFSFYQTKMFVFRKHNTQKKSRGNELFNGTSPSFKLPVVFENGLFEVESLILKMTKLRMEG